MFTTAQKFFYSSGCCHGICNNEGCLPVGKIIILTGGCSYIIFSYSSMISLCNIASFPLVINNNSTFKVFKGTSTVNLNQFVLTVPQYLDSLKSPNYHFDTIDKIVLLQDCLLPWPTPRLMLWQIPDEEFAHQNYLPLHKWLNLSVLMQH